MDEWTGVDQQPGWELLGRSSGERDACPEHQPWQVSKSLSYMFGGAVPQLHYEPRAPQNLDCSYGTRIRPEPVKTFLNWNQRLRTDSPQMGSCVFYAYPSLDS